MNIKKTIAVVVTGGMLLSGIAAYAAVSPSSANPRMANQYSTTAPRYGIERNADFLAKLTGMSVDQIISEFNAGKTMVQIAEENGVTLDNLKKALIEQKEGLIDQMVKDGRITQETANTIKQNIQERINSWDGTCQFGKNAGNGLGIGFGKNNDKAGNGSRYAHKGMYQGSSMRGTGFGTTIQK